MDVTVNQPGTQVCSLHVYSTGTLIPTSTGSFHLCERAILDDDRVQAIQDATLNGIDNFGIRESHAVCGWSHPWLLLLELLQTEYSSDRLLGRPARHSHDWAEVGE